MRVITVYMKDGTTLRFNDVKDIRSTKRLLAFVYSSASRSSKKASAQFLVKNIAGVTIDLPEETPNA